MGKRGVVDLVHVDADDVVAGVMSLRELMEQRLPGGATHPGDEDVHQAASRLQESSMRTTSKPSACSTFAWEPRNRDMPRSFVPFM